VAEQEKEKKKKSTFIPDGYGLHTELYFTGFTDIVFLFPTCVLSWNNKVYYSIACYIIKPMKSLGGIL